MRCPRCNGLIMVESLLIDGYQIEDISCLNCGERFWPGGIQDGARPREAAEIELSNNFNDLRNRHNAL